MFSRITTVALAASILVSLVGDANATISLSLAVSGMILKFLG